MYNFFVGSRDIFEKKITASWHDIRKDLSVDQKKKRALIGPIPTNDQLSHVPTYVTCHQYKKKAANRKNPKKIYIFDTLRSQITFGVGLGEI